MAAAADLTELCSGLIRADSEAAVIGVLKSAGYWDDPRMWRWLGDEQYNYSSVGNQQSRAEQAIIEKLINAVDTKLIAAARIAGCLPNQGDTPQRPDTPKSIAEARQQFFGALLKDTEAMSRSIAVTATGAMPREGNGRPCFTITDDGEGQSARTMPDTILSLHAGNKDKIKFVQGKFNMGGTGVLEFCGLDRNLQLVVSRRNPALVDEGAGHLDRDWCFTVVRREDPTEGKSSRFTYLAPIGADAKPREGDLLHFPADSLPIFPEKNEPYVRHSKSGTLIKLYEYDAKRFRQNMMMNDSLMYRARLLLPEPALPIRFHECRGFKGHSGSFDTTMVGLIKTLDNDYDNPKRDNVEWVDELAFNVDGEQFTARIYVFKDKPAADSYRKDEGIVFTYNGQCHAVLTKDFFRRNSVRQDYLWHSLLVFVDCSGISTRAHEKLFMNSRDRLRDGDLRRRLEAELEDQIGHHEELRSLASDRRKKELSENPRTSESMAKVIEKLLTNNPMLAALLGQGVRIKNPHKPESVGAGIAGFIGKRFPTKFHFKGHEPDYELVRDGHMNSHIRLAFETDAANDYFKRDEQPGEFTLFRKINGGLAPATNYHRPRLQNGLAHFSLSLPEGAVEGDVLAFEAHTTDPSRLDPFVNSFVLNVKAERITTSGGTGSGGGGADPGTGKGSKGEGTGQSQDTQLDIPRPTPVHEKEWGNHDPAFDKFTAMRVMVPPDAEPGASRYDYFINMDNVYLQGIMKAQPKQAKALELRFSVGMTLIALSILHQDQVLKKNPMIADMPSSAENARDRVAHVTSAIAPFLLPMIESVSELEEDAESLSRSAGEAA
jgi:hypothetical protein